MTEALTILFAGTALWFLITCTRRTACTTERITGGSHVLMGASMLAMVWGTSLPLWLQVAFFTAVTLWFAGLATVPHRPHGFRALHHAVMAAAMVWMVIAMSTGHPMHHRSTSVTVIVSVALACYFVLAAVPLIYTALTHRHHPLDAAGHAVMSIGTGVLLLGML
jgi:Domain of unknown function (DUF5134)